MIFCLPSMTFRRGYRKIILQILGCLRLVIIVNDINVADGRCLLVFVFDNIHSKLLVTIIVFTRLSFMRV